MKFVNLRPYIVESLYFDVSTVYAFTLSNVYISMRVSSDSTMISLRVSIIVKNEDVACILGIFSNTSLMHWTWKKELLNACFHNNSDIHIENMLTLFYSETSWKTERSFYATTDHRTTTVLLEQFYHAYQAGIILKIAKFGLIKLKDGIHMIIFCKNR